MWIEATITNCLGGDPVEVQEGHSGKFTNLRKLKPRESVKVRFDTSATHREYSVVAPDNTTKLLGSDAIIENSAIKVVEVRDAAGNYGWNFVFTKRPEREAQPGGAGNPFLNTLNKLLGKT